MNRINLWKNYDKEIIKNNIEKRLDYKMSLNHKFILNNN